MHKPESIQENETHKILRDFEIETDHSRLDVVMINKKREFVIIWTLPFRVSQCENQRKQKDRQILGPY